MADLLYIIFGLSGFLNYFTWYILIATSTWKRLHTYYFIKDSLTNFRKNYRNISLYMYINKQLGTNTSCTVQSGVLDLAGEEWLYCSTMSGQSSEPEPGHWSAPDTREESGIQSSFNSLGKLGFDEIVRSFLYLVSGRISGFICRISGWLDTWYQVAA